MKFIINNLVIILVTIILINNLFSVCGSALNNKYRPNRNRPYHRSSKSYAHSSLQANKSPENNSDRSIKNTTDFDIFCDETETKLIGGGKLVKIKENRKCKNNFIGLKQHPRNKQYYYICQPDRILLGRCENSKIYNHTYKCCVSEGNRLITPIVYDEPKHKFNVSKCNASGIFPIEGQIRYYYTCVYLRDQFIQKIRKCPRGTIFNSSTGTCVERAKCAALMKTNCKGLDSVKRFKPTTEVIRPRKNVNSDEYLPCDTPGTYSTDDNPNYYYKCCGNRDGEKNVKIKLKCPSGKSFDSSSGECITNSDFFTKFPQNLTSKLRQHKKPDLINKLPRLLTAYSRRTAKQIESVDSANSDKTEEETIRPLVNKKFYGCIDVNEYAHKKRNTDSSQLQNTKEIEQNDGTLQRQPNRVKYGSDHENGYAELSQQGKSCRRGIECIANKNPYNNRLPTNVRSKHHCDYKFRPQNSAKTSTVKCKSENKRTESKPTVDNSTTPALAKLNSTISKKIPPILILSPLRSKSQNTSVLIEKETVLSTSQDATSAEESTSSHINAMTNPEGQKTIISNGTEPNTAESNTIVTIMKSALIPNPNSKELSFQKTSSKEEEPSEVTLIPNKSNVPITNLATTSTPIPTNLNSAELDSSTLDSTSEEDMSSLMLSAEESAILIPISTSTEQSHINNAGFTSLSSKYNTDMENPTTLDPLTTRMTTNKITIEESISTTDTTAFLVTTPIPFISEESDSSSINSPKLDNTTPIPTTAITEQSNINSFTTTSVTQSYSLDTKPAEELTSTTHPPSEDNMITKTPNPTTWTPNTTPQIQVAIKIPMPYISEEFNSTDIAASPLSTSSVNSPNLDTTTPISTTALSEDSNINSFTTTSVTRSYSLDTTLAEELTSTTPPPLEDNMITETPNPTTWTPNITPKIEIATNKATITDVMSWSTISSVPTTTPIPQATTTPLFRISVESSKTQAPTPKKLLTDSKSQKALDNSKSMLILPQEDSNLPSIITTSTIEPDRTIEPTFSQTTPPTSDRTTLEEISTNIMSKETDSTLDPLSETAPQAIINSYFTTASGQSNTGSLSTANPELPIADFASTPNPFISKTSGATTATTESFLTTYNPISSIDFEQDATTKSPTTASNEFATTSMEGLTIPEITTHEDIEKQIDSGSDSATSENDSAKKNDKNLDRNLEDAHSELGIDTKVSKATTNSTNILFADDKNYNGSNVSQNIEGRLNNIPEKGSGNGNNNDLGSEVGDSSKEYNLKEMLLKMNDSNAKDDRDYEQNETNGGILNRDLNFDIGTAANRLTGSVNPDKKSNDENFEFMSDESPGPVAKENKSPRKFSGENITLPEIIDSEIIGNFESQKASVDTVKVASIEDHNNAFELSSSGSKNNESDVGTQSKDDKKLSEITGSSIIGNYEPQGVSKATEDQITKQITSKNVEAIKIKEMENSKSNLSNENDRGIQPESENTLGRNESIEKIKISAEHLQIFQPYENQNNIVENKNNSKNSNEPNESQKNNSEDSNLNKDDHVKALVQPNSSAQNKTVDNAAVGEQSASKPNAEQNDSPSKLSNEGKSQPHDKMKDGDVSNETYQMKPEASNDSPVTVKIEENQNKSDDPKIDSVYLTTNDQNFELFSNKIVVPFEDTTKDKDSDLLADNLSKENNTSSSKTKSFSSENSELNKSYEMETTKNDRKIINESEITSNGKEKSTKSNPNSSDYIQILQPSKTQQNAAEDKKYIEKPNESNLGKDNKSEDDVANDSDKSKTSAAEQNVSPSKSSKIKVQSLDQMQDDDFPKHRNKTNDTTDKMVEPTEDTSTDKNSDLSADIPKEKKLNTTQFESDKKLTESAESLIIDNKERQEVPKATEGDIAPDKLTEQNASVKNTDAIKSIERTNNEDNLNSSLSEEQNKTIGNTKAGNKSASKQSAEQNDGPSKLSDEEKSQPHDKMKNDAVSKESGMSKISNDSPVTVKIEENRNKSDNPKTDSVNSNTNDQRPQNKIDINEKFKLLSNKSARLFEDTTKDQNSNLLADNMAKENKSSSKSTSLSSKYSELNINNKTETINPDDSTKDERKIIHGSEIISNGKENSTTGNLEKPNESNLGKHNKSKDDLANDSDKSRASAAEQNVSKLNSSKIKAQPLNQMQDDSFAKNRNKSNDTTGKTVEPTEDTSTNKNSDLLANKEKKLPESTESLTTDNKERQEASKGVPDKLMQQITSMKNTDAKIPKVRTDTGDKLNSSEYLQNLKPPKKQNNAAEDKNNNIKTTESKTGTQNKTIVNTKASNQSTSKQSTEQNENPSKLLDEDKPQPHDKIKKDNASNETIIPEASNDSPITVKIDENRNKSDDFKVDSVNSNTNDQNTQKTIDVSKKSVVPFEDTRKDINSDVLADNMSKENKSSSKTKSLTSKNSERSTSNKIVISNPDDATKNDRKIIDESQITSNGKEKSTKDNLNSYDYVQILQTSKEQKNASEDKKYIENLNESNLDKNNKSKVDLANDSDKSKASAQNKTVDKCIEGKQSTTQATAEQNVSPSKSSDKIKSQQANTTDKRVGPTEDSSKDNISKLLTDIPKENKLSTTQSERDRKLSESKELLIIDNKEPQEASKATVDCVPDKLTEHNASMKNTGAKKSKERTINEDKLNSSEHLQNLKPSEQQNNATEDKNGNKKPNESKTGTQNKTIGNTKADNQSVSAEQNVGPPNSSDKSKSQPDDKTKDVDLLNANIVPEATNDSPVAIKIDSSPLSAQLNEDESLMRPNDEMVFNPCCPNNACGMQPQCEASSDSNAYLNKLLENFDDLSKYILQARKAMIAAVA